MYLKSFKVLKFQSRKVPRFQDSKNKTQEDTSTFQVFLKMSCKSCQFTMKQNNSMEVSGPFFLIFPIRKTWKWGETWNPDSWQSKQHQEINISAEIWLLKYLPWFVLLLWHFLHLLLTSIMAGWTNYCYRAKHADIKISRLIFACPSGTGLRRVPIEPKKKPYRAQKGLCRAQKRAL